MADIYISKLKQLTTSFVILVLSVAIVSINSTQPTSAEPVRSFFKLGTLGGTNSVGNSINNAGKVAGWSFNTSSQAHAFLWDSTSGMLNLGTLGGDISMANDVNDFDVVVGEAQTNLNTTHAFIWQSGAMTDINPPGFDSSQAMSVNNSSQVVGYGHIGSQTAAFFWSQSTGFVTITTSAPSNNLCRANAINNNGMATGVCSNGIFVWNSSTQTINELGWFGADQNGAEAFDINSQGQIVGIVRGDFTAGNGVFMWDPTSGAINLSSLVAAQGINGSSASYAYGINDSSQIVGYYPVARTVDPCGPYHAYVWSQADGFTDVGQDGITTHGRAINNSSQITGAHNPYTCTDPVGQIIPLASAGLTASVALAAGTSGADTQLAGKWDAKIGTPKISVGDAAISRGNDTKNRTIQFPITLSEPATNIVTVRYTITAQGTDSAVPGTDFKVRSGTVSFKPNLVNGRTKTTVLVGAIVVPHAGVLTDQTFRVVLSSPTGGYELGNDIGTGTIMPPSATNTTVSIGDASVVEGDHNKNSATVWVTLSQPATSTQTVKVSFSNGTATANSDYKPLNTKTLTFNAGQWQKAITLTTLTDMVTESDETINVFLNNPSIGLTLGRSNGLINILNDD